MWREGAETQDGERKVKQSAEGKPENVSVALGDDEGSGSRPQQGGTVRDTGQVCEQDGTRLDCRVEKEGVYLQLPQKLLRGIAVHIKRFVHDYESQKEMSHT